MIVLMTALQLPPHASEGDVETQIILPLLTRAEYLGINLNCIRSKEYLSARDIGKGTSQKKGYIPDFCVYYLSLPVLVIEAKAPTVSTDQGYDEAKLYAHAINGKFPTGLNPCTKVLATNGIELLAGDWDSAPAIRTNVSDIMVGGAILDELIALLSAKQLQDIANAVSTGIKLKTFKRPFNQGNGPSLIASKLEQNTFAADLSPILRRYFSSKDQNRNPEIYSRAYVSSNEVTSYDRNLESYLKDRLSKSRQRTAIKTTKSRSDELSNKISAFSKTQSGDIQLVTGGVGVGKSLFARRYKEYLQPENIKQSSSWCFLDFNGADFNDLNQWTCKAFVRSLIEEGAPVNLRDADDQERVFAEDLNDRQAYYDRMEKIGQGRGELEKARDIEEWRTDDLRLTKGLARYLQGDLGNNLIVVFDNVDRRESKEQLAAFQTALWFLDQTRCLIILQMRDVTFESYKDQPPLDTYRTGQIFHISPPRFIDVVKRRLELSLEALNAEAPETVRYTTPSGTITYPKKRAGEFLNSIYRELFQKTSNISRVLEAIAGRDVRKALDMFLAIITSGHMPEDVITLVAAGKGIRRFPEYLIIRILMRQDYKFFNENSAFVANIFHTDTNWVRPSNFLIIEIIFFLIGKRKVQGDNGLMGFIALSRLQDSLEQMGFVKGDIFQAVTFALSKGLIEADASSASFLKDTDCVKATASGWAHLRILAARIEYLGASVLTTPVNDKQLEDRAFAFMQTENDYGKLSAKQTVVLVKDFQKYLLAQYSNLRMHPGYADQEKCGAKYILDKMAEAINFATVHKNIPTQLDWLDT